MPKPYSFGLRVRIVGRLHGSQTVNVLHFGSNELLSDGPSLDPILLALAQAVLACVVEKLLPAVTSDWHVSFVGAQRISPTVSQEVIAAPTGAFQGTLGPVSTSFIASLINLKTFRGDRSGRGRWFLPPPGEAQIAVSGIDNPTIALIAEFLLCIATKFVAPNNTEPHELVVFSRKIFSGIGGSFDSAAAPVTQLTTTTACAIMGSRKVGRGS